MRKNSLYILMIGLFLSLNACCTKKYCLGFDDLNEIQLLNFNSSEADSIAIERFAVGSNFSNRIDSSFTNASVRATGDTDLVIFLPEKIKQNYDYKITLLGAGRDYKLSNFEIRQEECNCPSDKFNVLDSYILNGQKINNSSLIISK